MPTQNTITVPPLLARPLKTLLSRPSQRPMDAHPVLKSLSPGTCSVVFPFCPVVNTRTASSRTTTPTANASLAPLIWPPSRLWTRRLDTGMLAVHWDCLAILGWMVLVLHSLLLPISANTEARQLECQLSRLLGSRPTQRHSTRLAQCCQRNIKRGMKMIVWEKEEEEKSCLD